MVGEQKGQSVDQSATPAERIVPARIDAIVGVVPCVDESPMNAVAGDANDFLKASSLKKDAKTGSAALAALDQIGDDVSRMAARVRNVRRADPPAHNLPATKTSQIG